MTDTHMPLGEELELLRDSVRRFAEQEIAPRAAAIDEENLFPTRLWRKLGDLGLLGLTVDEAWGGSGLGYLAHLVAMEEITRASGSVGLSYGAHSNLCVDNLARNGTDAQRERFLPRPVQRRVVGALAMCEPGAGSDVVGSMSCRAELQGDDWVANGNKMWITNGPEADVAHRVHAHRRAGSRSRCMTAFLVTPDLPGFAGPETRQAGHARLQHLRAGVRRLPHTGGQCARRG